VLGGSLIYETAFVVVSTSLALVAVAIFVVVANVDVDVVLVVVGRVVVVGGFVVENSVDA